MCYCIAGEGFNCTAPDCEEAATTSTHMIKQPNWTGFALCDEHWNEMLNSIGMDWGKADDNVSHRMVNDA